MSLTLKVFYEKPNGNKEIRRFQLNTSEDKDVFMLASEKIKSLYPDLRNGNFQLFWQDSDGDRIVFSCAEEMQEAIKEVHDGILRIYVTGQNSKSGSESKPEHQSTNSSQYEKSAPEQEEKSEKAFKGSDDPLNGRGNCTFHHFMHGFNTQHTDGQNSNSNAEPKQEEFHTQHNFQFKEFFNSTGAKISTFVDPSGGINVTYNSDVGCDIRKGRDKSRPEQDGQSKNQRDEQTEQTSGQAETTETDSEGNRRDTADSSAKTITGEDQTRQNTDQQSQTLGDEQQQHHLPSFTNSKESASRQDGNQTSSQEYQSGFSAPPTLPPLVYPAIPKTWPGTEATGNSAIPMPWSGPGSTANPIPWSGPGSTANPMPWSGPGSTANPMPWSGAVSNGSTSISMPQSGPTSSGSTAIPMAWFGPMSNGSTSMSMSQSDSLSSGSTTVPRSVPPTTGMFSSLESRQNLTSSEVSANSISYRPPPDFRYQQSLDQMLSMGFSNHDGWLSNLLIVHQGDIGQTLDAIQASRRQ